MKPVHVNPSIYLNFNKERPKFKVADNVRMSKCKNIFTKDYASNWSEEVFAITKVKNTVPWRYVISDLKGEEIVRTLYKNELHKKQIKKSLELKN